MYRYPYLMNKEKFKELYYNNTDSYLANMLGVHHKTIKNMARRLGLRKGCGYIYPNDIRKLKKIRFTDE